MPLEVLLVEDSPGDVRLTSATLVRTSSCTWLPMALPPWPFSDARAATAKPLARGAILHGLRFQTGTTSEDLRVTAYPPAVPDDQVAVHQIGAHLALQHAIAPVADVLEDQQAQHNLGRCAQPTATAALGMPPRQRLVHRSYDLFIRQHSVGVFHPTFAKIAHFFGAGAYLQPLRPRSDLLCRRLCAGGPISRPACRRSTLPDEPPRAPGPCGTGPSLARPAKECDASGFTTTATG